MAVKGETRQRIIDTAGRLFKKQGYHATGLNQILAESKSPKGSMYFHFPGGKEQLAAEALDRSAAELLHGFDFALEHSEGPAEAVIAVAAHLAEGLTRSQFADGCPISTVALEAAATSEPVRLSCRAGFDSWIAVFAKRLAAEGIEPDSAEELATMTVMSLEGALILSRVRRDTAPLHTAAARLGAMITAATPTS